MTRRRPTAGWASGTRGDHDETAKRSKRAARSPCNRPPSAPVGLTGSFDRTEGGKHNRVAANLRWTEVTTDTSGLSSRVRDYVVELEGSLTESPTDWFLVDRWKVPAKSDTDAGTKAHKRVRRLRARLSYRFSVVAIDVDGCRSAPSATYLLGFPNPETPPGPSDVKIFDRARDRIVMRFEVPIDPDDPAGERLDPRVDDFGAEISLFPHFGVIYDRDRHFRGGRISFKTDPEDRGAIFYGRVWANPSDDGPQSLKVPAWNPTLHNGEGNDSPFEAPDGVVQATGDRQVVRFTVSGKVRQKVYPVMFTADRDYDLRKVRATVGDHDPATHPNDGCPQGSALKLNLVHISADLTVRTNVFTAEDRVKIDENTHKDAQAAGDANVNVILEDEHLVLKVTQIGSSQSGSDLAVYVVLDPRD